MASPITNGIHHVGLTVSSVEESAAFFISILDWHEVRRDRSYPAIFVSDGTTMLSLWQNKTNPCNRFDKNSNIGLHHLAIMAKTENDLLNIYHRIVENNIQVEFSPELLRDGPAKHMMCYEPGGIRIEFIWPGN